MTIPSIDPSGNEERVAGHSPTAEGKTYRDWAFRQHCKRDGEPWPCRTVLLAERAAIPRPSAEGLDRDALWAEFEAYEAKWAAKGSGMTRDQLTGAAMMLGWVAQYHPAALSSTSPEEPGWLRPGDDFHWHRLWAFRGGEHLFLRLGLGYQHVAVSRVPSWDQPCYSRFGGWFHHRGLTLRYRGWLLLITVRS